MPSLPRPTSLCASSNAMTFIVLSLSPTPISTLSPNPYPPTCGLHQSPSALLSQWLTCISCFPASPLEKSQLPSGVLLCTRYFGLSGTNLLQPRHRPSSFYSMPYGCGPAGLLPHTVLAPTTAARARLQDLGLTVWEDRHPSDETHSHLWAPALYPSCVSWIAPSCIFVGRSGQSVLLRG